MATPREAWSSRAGVILAVAGSAVGLGNFLRFPGLAAQYGGGAFMIAYFVSLLIIGIPVCWSEWTLGRLGGRMGFHSSAGIYHAIIRRPWAKYLGAIGFMAPVMIYMYYVYVEAWCLGYAVQAIRGDFIGPDTDFGAFFANFTGLTGDGDAIRFGAEDAGLFVAITFALNFFFIYRGISKGIEKVCLYAMPALIVIGFIILVRVLTLGTPDPAKPDQNLLNGLGYMWNPGDVLSGLRNPQLWLAAAGQIFFSLSVGFGVIITYASYLRKNDDVVLSSLTATSANEFCEVGLGGLITVPAAFVFLGAAGVAGQGTFGLGFNALPEVFSRMPGGQFFAAAFFILLFLAAITSSLSMLQPGIAFLEEGLGLRRRGSIALLGFVTTVGTLFVWYFSKDLKALDTIDFWAGTFLIFIQGTFPVIVFGWVLGVERGFAEAHRGALMRIPGIFKPTLRYLSPAFLIVIFITFVLEKMVGWNFKFGAEAAFAPTSYVADLLPGGSGVARASMILVVAMLLFSIVLIHLSGKRWARHNIPDLDSKT